MGYEILLATDRQTQRQFDIHWDKGELNNADYYTKHHSEKHHKEMRHLYVIDEIQNVINNLNPSIQATNQQWSLRVRGCAGTVAEDPKTGHGTGHGTCASERTPTDNPLQLVGGIANPRLRFDAIQIALLDRHKFIVMYFESPL